MSATIKTADEREAFEAWLQSAGYRTVVGNLWNAWQARASLAAERVPEPAALPAASGYVCADCKAPLREGYTCDACDSDAAEPVDTSSWRVRRDAAALPAEVEVESIRRLFVEHGHLYAGWLELARAILALATPIAAQPAAAEPELRPVEPRALALSIADLECWDKRADGEPLTQAESESVWLVLHELKRLRALPAQAAAVPEQTVGSALTEFEKTFPAHIWLDAGEEMEFAEAGCTFRDLQEVTWSEDNATGIGVKYIRSDLATLSRPTAAGEAEPKSAQAADKEAAVRQLMYAAVKAERLLDKGNGGLLRGVETHVALKNAISAVESIDRRAGQ